MGRYIVRNCTRSTLQTIIKGKVNRDSTIYSDKRRGYNGLVDLGYKKHYRLDHEKDRFVSGKSYINGIEARFGVTVSITVYLQNSLIYPILKYDT